MRCNLVISAMFLSANLAAQRQVAAVPFEFSHSSGKERFETHYLSGKNGESFSLILKDNNKVSYILFDKNFRQLNRIDQDDFYGTVFENYSIVYSDGAVDENKFNYIFHTTDNKSAKEFICNSVDFDNNTVKSKSLFTKENGEENDMVAFSYDGIYYYLVAIDTSNEIKVRMVTPDGVFTEKIIKFPMPSYITRIDVKLTKYLWEPMFVLNENDLTLPQAKYFIKIYPGDKQLMLVADWTCKPVQVFTINLRDFSTRNQFFNPFPEIMEWSKTSPMIKSAVLDNKLFFLISYPDKFRLSVHDLQSKNVLKTIEINKDFPRENFSESPVSASKRGHRYEENELKKWYKEFKNIFDGGQAIMVRKSDAGYYELTFGIHRSIPQFDYRQVGSTSGRRGEAKMLYDADHYDQIRFRLDLDTSTLDIVKGAKGPPVDVSKKLRYLDKILLDGTLPTHFLFNDKEYAGYYEVKKKQYIIEEVIKE